MSQPFGIRIDARTGEVRLPSGVLGPALTHAAFLGSPLCAGAKDWVVNEPWHSYQLPRIPIRATELIVTLYFEGERLTQVDLFDADPAFGSSGWEDWSEDKELARKARHEEWLSDVFDAPLGKYPWGMIASTYDARSGSSNIILAYRRPRR